MVNIKLKKIQNIIFNISLGKESLSLAYILYADINLYITTERLIKTLWQLNSTCGGKMLSNCGNRK